MYQFNEHYVAMSDGVNLYTYVALPRNSGEFPVVFFRSPYCSREVDPSHCLDEHKKLLDNGYAVVYQHCRGTGKSQGECIPYLHERKDGLEALEWLRKQSFYKGEIYLCGGSYTSSVHLLYLDTKPADVMGAILEVQDCNRYNILYRNGFFKCGLHGGWYVGMYKMNNNLDKHFVQDSFKTMPLSSFSKTVFGEEAVDFDESLKHPDKHDAFWSTPLGGGESHNAVRDADIPILLTTSFYDIYTEGVFDMWESIKPETRQHCAMIVTPYDHAQAYDPSSSPIKFENGELSEVCPDYVVNWLNHIRLKQPLDFIRPGEIVYYALFRNEWMHDAHLRNGNIRHDFYLNNRFLSTEPASVDAITYTYNPYAPATFHGGVCNNFGGMQIQDTPNSRYDIISFISEPFEEGMYVQGTMEAELAVRTDCEDTCFYVRVSIVKDEVAYALRDDITSVCLQYPEYRPNAEVTLKFAFAPHAFAMHKGDRLRVDVSSSAFPHFSLHTNRKGLQSAQTAANIAHNTIICGKSKLSIYEDNSQ